MNGRQFTIGLLATAGIGLNALRAEPKSLAGKLGLVTASLSPHFSKERAAGKITLLDFPQFTQEELGLEIIDFNTMNFHTYEPAYLEKLRANIEKFGWKAMNLKMNQKVDMASED
ncbi:hypothetical protein N8813_03675 [bacterium]|jgi:hypothetical protein|nr:hypothetical protein [bacterium]MDC0275807.1 hypothetical protein [Verrucomicrobiales bacterium]